MGESALTGTGVGERLQDGAPLAPLADLATGFLIDLAAGAQPAEPAQWWAEHVEPACATLARSRLAGDELLARARAVTARLGPLPAVVAHGDFTPWNTLVGERGELLVLDWEHAHLCGLPATDLVYFLAHAAFFAAGTMDSPGEQDTYAGVANGRTAAGALLAACERRYADAVGLAPEDLGPLRVLTWLVQAALDVTNGIGGRARVLTGFLRQEVERCAAP